MSDIRTLYHGTSLYSATMIQVQGFNVSLTPTSGRLLGIGAIDTQGHTPRAKHPPSA